MPLIDLQTNLRDLQFGRDRVAGGNSEQPFIQTKLPGIDESLQTFVSVTGEETILQATEFSDIDLQLQLPISGTGGPDFLLRGGALLFNKIEKDVKRLSKFFASPNGLLFIIKQNLLSKTAVDTQARFKLLNEGIYTPLGTLAQSAGLAFGLHTNKQGVNPFENFSREGHMPSDPGSLGEYFQAVNRSNTDIVNREYKRNRLVGFYKELILEKPFFHASDIYSYRGGPGSFLGFGKTHIKFATGNGKNDVRTGKNNDELRKLKFFNGSKNKYQTKEYDYLVFKAPLLDKNTINGRILLGASPLFKITLDKNGFNNDGSIDFTNRKIGNLYLSDNVDNDKKYANSDAPKAKKDIEIKYLNRLINGVTNTANFSYKGFNFDSGFDNNGYLDISSRNIGSLYSINNVAFDNKYAISGDPIAKKDINFDETEIDLKFSGIANKTFNDYIPRLKLTDSIANNYTDWNNSKSKLPRKPNADLTNIYSPWASQLLYQLYTPGTPSVIYHPSSINTSIKIGEYGLEQNFPNSYFIPKTFTPNQAFKQQKNWTTVPVHPITNYSKFFQASTAYQTKEINRNPASILTNPNIDLNFTFTTIDKDSKGFGQGLTRTYTQKDINIINESNNNNIGELTKRVGGGGSTTTVKDFRESIRKRIATGLAVNDVNNVDNVGNLAKSRNYDEGKIEKKFGDPGDRAGKNISSYISGSYTSGGSTPLGAASSLSYDKVTWSPLYKSDKVNPEDKKDLIPFRIGVIDNDFPSKKTYIHFRAFLDSISDSYKAEWKGERYVGRGENMYTYGGFDRTVSLGWTVAAQSKAELMPMYKKLNFLASVCAPDYGKSGYMRGNIVTLTIGGYFYEQPGIINGFTYEMNEDKDTWEIALGIDNENDDIDNVVQVPHIIRVKSFQFTPIHTFVPRLQQNTFNDFGGKETDGKEHFIALEDDFTNNWNLKTI